MTAGATPITHFQLLNGRRTACGLPARGLVTTYDPEQVTCLDCRGNEAMTVSEILTAWGSR